MTRPRRRMAYDHVLIVGAGRAGLAAVEELRRSGFRGQIAVIGEEHDPPYDRTACSKSLLTGKARPRDLLLPLRDCPDVQWHLGRRAVSLDATNHIVQVDTGERYHYEALVIATGGHPVAPRGWPLGEPGIHVLHGLADAWALRKDLRDARRVAIVGAGLTGCETASAVRALARDCVLIDAGRQVMRRAVGELVGDLLTEEIGREGVALRLGHRVQDVRRRRRGWAVCPDSGEEIEADLVVAAAGQRPDTAWLRSVPGLDTTDGVLCDEQMRVIGADAIVAAGAVARWPNLRYGPAPARVGQWISAVEQGRGAARTLLAVGGFPPPVTLTPRYWSDQFGLRIQVCGELPADAQVSVTELRPGRPDRARAGVLARYAAGGRLVGLVGINAGQAFTAAAERLLMARPVPETPVRALPSAPSARALPATPHEPTGRSGAEPAPAAGPGNPGGPGRRRLAVAS